MKGQQIEILKLIVDNKTALSNRDGQKPLFIIAEKIALKGDSELEKDAESQILNIDLKIIDIEQLNTLLSFIHYSKMDVENILHYFYKYITTEFNDTHDETVVKRGLLIRFIIEQNTKFFKIKDLLSEKLLREKSPWIWIDCVSYFSWSIAEDEISIQLSKRQDEFKNLLYRIPSFYKRVDNHAFYESLKVWHANLSKSDKQKLDKWASKFKVKVSDMSLEAINKIDKLPLFQKELMEY